jgi:hypothetical protein
MPIIPDDRSSGLSGSTENILLLCDVLHQSGSPQKNFKEWVFLKADLQCIPPHGKTLWGNNHAQTNQHGLLPTAATLFYHVSRIPAQQNRKQYSSHFLIYAAGKNRMGLKSPGVYKISCKSQAYNSGLHHLKEECIKGVIKRLPTLLPEWMDQLT